MPRIPLPTQPTTRGVRADSRQAQSRAERGDFPGDCHMSGDFSSIHSDGRRRPTALRDSTQNIRSMAIVMTCQTMGTSYEHDPHWNRAIKEGVPKEKMSALGDFDKSALFSELREGRSPVGARCDSCTRASEHGGLECRPKPARVSAERGASVQYRLYNRPVGLTGPSSLATPPVRSTLNKTQGDPPCRCPNPSTTHPSTSPAPATRIITSRDLQKSRDFYEQVVGLVLSDSHADTSTSAVWKRCATTGLAHQA